MSFRKRNKIKLPGISKEEDDVRNGNTQIPTVPLQFDNGNLDDEDDIQPTIKLKKGKRKDFVPSVSSSENGKNIQEDTSKSTNVSPNDKDVYGTLFKGKSKSNIVLNLEDESEIDDIEVDNHDEEDDNSGILTSEQIRKIKEKKETIRRKNEKKKEVEKERFSERDYAKLLTSEEKADLLDTFKDNGGIAKLNEYKDIRNQEGFIDDIVEDGRLALTEKERIKEQENRREMIEEAARNEFTTGDHSGNTNGSFIDDDYNAGYGNAYNPDHEEIFRDEYNYSRKSKHDKDNYKLLNKKIAKRPILWHKTENLEGDEIINAELARLSLKLKTIEIRYAMLESEKSKLIQNGKEILAQLLDIQEDK